MYEASAYDLSRMDKFLDGKFATKRAIAKHLGLSPGSVSALLHADRQALDGKFIVALQRWSNRSGRWVWVYHRTDDLDLLGEWSNEKIRYTVTLLKTMRGAIWVSTRGLPVWQRDIVMEQFDHFVRTLRLMSFGRQ